MERMAPPRHLLRALGSRRIARVVSPMASFLTSSILVAAAVTEGIEDIDATFVGCAAGAFLSLANAGYGARRLLRRSATIHFPTVSRRAMKRVQKALRGIALSPREREFVQAFLFGHSMKEIAASFGVAHSTVRNVFSSAYPKLGVSGCVELMARYGEGSN
ncbi:MAG TPA: helix-turn-helix transcriptional regulator [Rectinemataceae bacterium]|nr:helix-turn-helix transcriptional regulator [Rectinemataceae bacterium]